MTEMPSPTFGRPVFRFVADAEGVPIAKTGLDEAQTAAKNSAFPGKKRGLPVLPAGCASRQAYKIEDS